MKTLQTRLETLAALVGSAGCVIFALFIFFGFFGSPMEGRIDPLVAAVLTFGLLVGTGTGVYVAFLNLRNKSSNQ